MLESFKSSNFEYKRLTEEEQRKRGILGRIVGPIADYKHPTRNGRKYTEKLWEKVFNDPIVKEKIENRCLVGELGHPEDRLETDMSKICICLAEQPKKSDDGKLYGVFDVLDTPNGRILKTLLDYGTNIGVSSRGEGDLTQDYMGEEIVDPNTYQYECHDAVLIPAVKEARLKPVTESLNKGKSLKQALLEDLRNSNDNDRLVMNDTLESLGIKLDEGIQYKGYDMTITKSGVQLRKSDGTLVREFPTEEEAREYVDEMNESLKESGGKKLSYCEFDFFYDDSYDQSAFEDDMNDALREAGYTYSGAIDFESMNYQYSGLHSAFKGAKKNASKCTFSFYSNGYDNEKLGEAIDSVVGAAGAEWTGYFDVETEEDTLEESVNESSKQDVDIQKKDEKKEADNDGADLVVELQETLLRNADLEKVVKGLQERLSVCYAKEKRYEGQVNAYKNSIQSLQENSKKANSLEGRLNSLQEKLNSCKSDIEEKDKQISTLKNTLVESKKMLKQEAEEHAEKQQSAKEIVEELSKKVQTLQEELDSTKQSKTASVKVLKETYTKKESDLNSKITELQKDSSQKMKQLQEKLDRAQEIATKYQDIAKKAVNKYIVEKTNALNISADEVRNRLGKSYSFNDIDRICESLSANKLAVNKLPFKVSQVSNVKVKESVKPSISSAIESDGDYIDDQLAGLVERLY